MEERMRQKTACHYKRGEKIFGRRVTEKNASIDQKKKTKYKIFKY
jgi:hypothetical protein